MKYVKYVSVICNISNAWDVIYNVVYLMCYVCKVICIYGM